MSLFLVAILVPGWGLQENRTLGHIRASRVNQKVLLGALSDSVAEYIPDSDSASSDSGVDEVECDCNDKG